MNREIKFRMWNRVGGNIQKSRMFYDTSQVMECLKQQILFNNKSKLGYNHVADGNVFMQYTGIKDKNGKEIYEGDIVEVAGNVRYDVIYVDSDVKSEVYASFALLNKERDLLIHFDSYAIDKLEVLGNIFENPELLTNQ